MDGLTTSSNSSKKSFNHTAKGMLGSVSAGLEEEEGPPALKAAATDPRGAFTAAAAKAGGGEADEECPPALKAAAADPTGAFTAMKNLSWSPPMPVQMWEAKAGPQQKRPADPERR